MPGGSLWTVFVSGMSRVLYSPGLKLGFSSAGVREGVSVFCEFVIYTDVSVCKSRGQHDHVNCLSVTHLKRHSVRRESAEKEVGHRSGHLVFAGSSPLSTEACLS